MAVIKQLKNFFTGMIIYPKTLTKAVYDENGERLDKILRDTMLAVEDETYNGVEPRDADTLGGKYTSNDIKELKENVTQLNTILEVKCTLYKNVEYTAYKYGKLIHIHIYGNGVTTTSEKEVILSLPYNAVNTTVLTSNIDNKTWVYIEKGENTVRFRDPVTDDRQVFTGVILCE